MDNATPWMDVDYPEPPQQEYPMLVHLRCLPLTMPLCLAISKNYACVKDSMAQLIVYLASLRQSPLERKWKDATVYGVASDGFTFGFVKISHDGTVKRSQGMTLCAVN
ncbi:uncharacterized protein LACBIDRAFT_331602 [Laccaria bicolor S238N-H82]|uniref:Predicted protein n=1 Tax=Laccaria bicolor (strain S238N-H82 / ATCC MYA-4686) TaxID=486041 RepID=B0DPZ3_LACBS|nr:uncharacterized protein LACBIDRAFT_331602 [Laccaria bicolor S238N-H82]EDR03296.1 predicted protein [Laccaria bicolor S238N-H82]|eukprot:XP_001886092.1 predicted protein [Laccaria bicolor S238N-H82]